MVCISTLRQADDFQSIRELNVSQCGNISHRAIGICSQYTICATTPATHSLIGEQSTGVFEATKQVIINDQREKDDDENHTNQQMNKSIVLNNILRCDLNGVIRKGKIRRG